MSDNERKGAQDDARAILASSMFLAKVDAKTGNRIRIRRLTEASSDGVYYPAWNGLAAAVSIGDTVECHVIEGQVIVAGWVRI